jgi:hypothetical protein
MGAVTLATYCQVDEDENKIDEDEVIESGSFPRGCVTGIREWCEMARRPVKTFHGLVCSCADCRMHLTSV